MKKETAHDTLMTPQRRINNLVFRYANEKGYTVQVGWGVFERRYNQKFRTDLARDMRTFCRSKRLKRLTRTMYLVKSGRIDRGMQVIDEMAKEMGNA